MDLGVPKTWDEYLKQVEFFTKDGMHGVVNQGLRPDPIAMEWSNYLFANGGEYHDDKWNPTFNNEKGVKAVEQYATAINKYGPVGSASFSFDEAFNVMAQGKAYSYITYNFFRTAYDDPAKSAVVGKVEIMPVPGPTADTGGSLNGAWGWAIPKSLAQLRTPPGSSSSGSRARRSPRSARWRAARRPAPTCSTMPRCNKKYPYAQALKQMLLTSHNFPVFTYTPQMVEVLGRELSLAVAGEKSPQDALAQIETEFDRARQEGRQAAVTRSSRHDVHSLVVIAAFGAAMTTSVGA